MQVKVIVPVRAKVDEAKKFLNSRLIWVQNSLIKIKAKQKAMLQKHNSSKKNILTAEEFVSKSRYLVNRCKELAAKHNFKIGKVTLRRQKTLWGSCSARNNISLNNNLVFLDNTLIDYVICHELTHIKIKNHSKNFWKKLEEILPGAKTLDRQLRKHSPNFLNLP